MSDLNNDIKNGAVGSDANEKRNLMASMTELYATGDPQKKMGVGVLNKKEEKAITDVMQSLSGGDTNTLQESLETALKDAGDDKEKKQRIHELGGKLGVDLTVPPNESTEVGSDAAAEASENELLRNLDELGSAGGGGGGATESRPEAAVSAVAGKGAGNSAALKELGDKRRASQRKYRDDKKLLKQGQAKAGEIDHQLKLQGSEVDVLKAKIAEKKARKAEIDKKQDAGSQPSEKCWQSKKN